jgi:molecular chaperone DnaJ
MMKDFYNILGVAKDASQDAIKKAYRRLAHKYHPDKNPGNKQAEEKFKEVNQAYEVLGDVERRKKFDRGDTFTPEDFAHAAPGSFRGNFSDLFGDLFGDFFGGGGSRRPQPSMQTRGADRLYHLNVDFRTAVFGGEKIIDVMRNQRCGTCAGTGAKPGSTPQICHACGGAGEIRVQQGFFAVNKRCTYCKGRGKIISSPCPTCHSSGTTEQYAKLKVRIPEGADSGLTLRYAGEGEPGVDEGPAGDLLIVLAVGQHDIFRREGNDILCDVPITFALAALGGQIDVPTLDGKVRMKVPPGTQTGKVFRLRGKGVPSSSGRGDQHVTVAVETPQHLSHEVKAALEVLRAAETDPKLYPAHTAFTRKLRA